MLAHSYHPDHPPRPLSPPLTPPGTESDKSSSTSNTTTTQSTPTTMENPLYNHLHPDPTNTQLRVKDEFCGFNNNKDTLNSPRLESTKSEMSLLNRMKQWKEDHLEPQGTTLQLNNDSNGFTSSSSTSNAPSSSSSSPQSQLDLERYKSGQGQASSVNDFKPSKEHQDDRERIKNKIHSFKQQGQEKLIELGLRESSVSQSVREDEKLDPKVKGMLDRPLKVEREADSSSTTTDGEYLSGDETETEGEGRSNGLGGRGLLMPKLGRMLTQESSTNGGYSTSAAASFYSAESDFNSTVESLNLPSSSSLNGHGEELPRARSESPVSFTVDGTCPPRLSPFKTNNSPSSNANANGIDRSPVAFAPGYVHTNSRLVPTTPATPSSSIPNPPSPKPSSSPRLSIPLPYVSTPSSPGRLVPTASIVKPSTSHPSLALAAQTQPHAVHQHSNLAPPSPFQPSHQPTRRASTTATSHPPPSNLSSSSAVRRGSSASTHLRPHASSASHPHPPHSSSSSSSMMPARSLSASILPPSPSGGISQQFLPPVSQSSYTSLSYPPLSSSLQSPSLSRGTMQPSIHDDVELSIAHQAEQIRRQRLEKRAEAERAEGKGKGREREDDGGGGLGLGALSTGEGGMGRRRTSRNTSASRSGEREGQGVQGVQGGGMVNSSSSTSTIQAMAQNSSALSTSSLVPPPPMVGVGLGKSPSVRSSSLPQSQREERSASGGSSMMNSALREKEREKEHGLVMGSSRRTVSGDSQQQQQATMASSTSSPPITQQTSPQLARMNSTMAQSPQFGNNMEKGQSVEEGEPGVNPLVGNLIGTDHENYVLMYNMLTGIRIGVSRCQAKAARPLTDADYTARHKFSFDIVGNELTPSVRYDFKFKDYAPWVFRELREYFFLDPSDYLISLTAKYILSELGSPGKSGSFFYFSRDYRFIIKTIRHAEHKFLRKILKEYHEHVKKNPHTLLSRFYGLHRVKLPHGRKIHFVIMNNLFPPHRDIHETYDLKGSSIGRMYPESLAAHNPHATLKDLNWIYRHRQLALGPEKKALFEEQLRRDTELMQKLGIMDYSLLTGVHMAVKGNDERLREGKLSVFQPDAPKPTRKLTQVHRSADASALRAAVQRSDPQSITTGQDLPEHDTSTERRRFLFYQDEGGMRATGDENEDLGVIYYLGIIDILTPYTLVKRLEHFFKGIKNDKHCISAVPPKEYGDRFLGFIRSCIRGNPESLRPKMCMPSIIEEGEEEGDEGGGRVEKGCCPPMKNGGKKEEMREKTEVDKGKEKVQ